VKRSPGAIRSRRGFFVFACGHQQHMQLGPPTVREGSLLSQAPQLLARLPQSAQQVPLHDASQVLHPGQVHAVWQVHCSPSTVPFFSSAGAVPNESTVS
jgi:hypothetical protein